MKKVVFLLAIIIVAAFGINTRVQTVLAPINDNHVMIGTPVIPSSGPVSPLMPLIGRQDVVGYTTWDWQANGPVGTWCNYDPIANGIHAYWMWCDGVSANRNERYNFYDFSTRTWNWPASGINCFTIRSGYGSFDYDPITGNGIPSTHHGGTGTIYTELARDQAPGAGLFEYSAQPIGFEWPYHGVTHNQVIHIATVEQLMGDTLYYVKNNPWNTWSTPLLLNSTGNEPAFPDYNIAASKTSNKVAIMWQTSNDLLQGRAFYRQSTDGGGTWGTETQIPFPPGTGYLPGYGITSLYGTYDNSDNLRIAVTCSDTNVTVPCDVYLYSPSLGQPWTHVYAYRPDTLTAPVGYNAIFCSRPSVVQAPTASGGNIYVAWERFDSLNYEPLTTLSRAEIMVAELTNNGQTVSRLGCITDPNTTSKRFPVLGGVKADTVFVQYMIDSIAGFELYAQGRFTFNPVVLHRFHRNSLPIAIAEENPGTIYNLTLNSASPNPFIYTTNITYTVPISGIVNLTIYDILGRPVRTMVSGTKTPGEYTAIWDGKDTNGNRTQAGIYFYTLKTADKSVSRKIIRTN
jgi:hypothetical protein